jgi:hypothetical protein
MQHGHEGDSDGEPCTANGSQPRPEYGARTSRADHHEQASGNGHDPWQDF